MLLQYNFDTKDSDMSEAAIELRRRIAARRLERSISVGVVDEDRLLKLKDVSRKELKTHGHENFTIAMAGVTEKITVARAVQQLGIEESMRILDRDLDRVQKLSKNRIDTLTDLEKRITEMRSTLRDPRQKPVEEEIGIELRVSNRTKTDKLFEICTRCQRRVLRELFAAHSHQCAMNDGKIPGRRAHESKPPVYDANQDLVTNITTFPPRPPRNCRVVEKGATFIRWEWDEPVTDGGLPVFEYELQYVQKHMEMDKKTKKFKTTITEVSSKTSTLWCATEPVCHTGFKMVGLYGNCEYSRFRIRCQNLRGYSEFIDMLPYDHDDIHVPSVMTEDVEPPSPPLFFRLIDVTSSCIHLEWDPPFTNGGSDLFEYLINYTVCEKRNTTTERDVIFELDEVHHTENTECAGVLRHLPADTKVIKISIRAVNRVGLASEPMKLPNLKDDCCFTKPSSRHALIQRELERCRNSSDQFIDTSFFTGVQQRLLRIDFMKALLAEAATAVPDEIETLEAREWAAVLHRAEDKAHEHEQEVKRREAEHEAEFGEGGTSEGQEDEARVGEAVLFTNRQRRQHFKRKIETLEVTLVNLKHEKQFLDQERSRLTNFMKKKQREQMMFKLERDRVKDFKGGTVTSSVLMGAPMQYSMADFMRKIEKAALDCAAEISESKFTVMNGEVRKARIKIELERATLSLKDRRAVFLRFDLQHKANLKAMRKLANHDMDEKIMKKYFALLHENMMQRKHIRELITHLFIQRVVWQKKNAFNKWARDEAIDSVHPGLMHQFDNTKPFSLGGTMLEKSREARVELQGLLRIAIAGTTSLSQKFKMAEMATDNRKKLVKSKDFRGMSEGMDHVRLAEEGLHYLYEGDGFAVEGKYDLGRESYENQIVLLRSKGKNLNIKHLSITHGHLGQMFLRQGKFDRAIVEFDRQLSLAREIDDKPEAADAYFGMGTGYLEIRNYDDAIRYLDIAQTRQASVGNMPKYCGAMRALRECYQRLGKTEAVTMYDDKIDRMENELSFKFTIAKQRLTSLASRLNNNNAGIENTVHIERTSLKAIQLRSEVLALTEQLEEAEDLEDKQEEECSAIEAKLNAIQNETTMAYETDEPEMITLLVHSQPQMMEVEELKNRLAKLKVEQVAKFQVAKDGNVKTKTLIRNLEDTIAEKNELLMLENGELMKHTRHDLAFRCVAFCAANAAGDEVTGTSTGGAENFIAAECGNIHVVDYHSGELLHVFAGESKGAHREGKSAEKTGHEGVVTCLVHDCEYFFSGGTDEYIIKWHIASKSLSLVFQGHEGSITALAVDGPWLCSGAADATTRLWDKLTGVQMRIVYGHQKSVLTIDVGSTWMVTGSMDEDVRVWGIELKGKHTLAVDCKKRLQGHECAVTCVKYGKLEIMSGDTKGRIFIWWMKTGEVLRVVQAHRMAIRSMQFDAVAIVSGSVDTDVAITDVATGEVLQLLRGHEGSVMAVAFDSERIISAGGDNTLRFWQWGKKDSGPQDKFHVLEQGQNMLAVSKLYHGTTVQNLMKWNGITDAKQIYAGMKLIVQKGDPLALTDAEKAQAERDRRRQAGMSMTSKRLQKSGTMKATLQSYNRVHRNATDMDYHSLGNRMFKQAKSDHELFPDFVDLDANPYSLSQRIAKPEEHGLSLGGGGGHGGKNSEARYFMSIENMDEWGPISDAICLAMLELLVSYESYDLVLESKRATRSTTSVIGRIFAYERKIEDLGSKLQHQHEMYHEKKKRFLMPEERKKLRREERKREKERMGAEDKQDEGNGKVKGNDDVEGVDVEGEDNVHGGGREKEEAVEAVVAASRPTSAGEMRFLPPISSSGGGGSAKSNNNDG